MQNVYVIFAHTCLFERIIRTILHYVVGYIWFLPFIIFDKIVTLFYNLLNTIDFYQLISLNSSSDLFPFTNLIIINSSNPVTTYNSFILA